MNRLCARTLPAAELTTATAHLTECTACHEQFRARIARRRGQAPLSFSLAPEIWLQHEHLDYELLHTYTGNTLPAEEREIVDVHLALCARCREDVRSLQAFQRVIAPELKIAYAPAGTEAGSQRGRSFRENFIGWLRPPVYAAALCALLLTVGAFWWLRLDSRETTPQAGLRPTPAVAVNTGNSNNSEPPRVRTTESPAQVVAPTPESQLKNPAPTAQASAKRTGPPEPPRSQPGAGGLTHKQPAAPTKTGPGSASETQGDRPDVAALPAATRQEVTAALQSQRLEKPAVLGELAGGVATLRGNPAEKQNFRLLGPVAQVTLATQPVLRWQALSAATGYRVFVLNAQGQEVAASSELPASQTTWQPAAPLPAGATYSWAVVALIAEKEIVAPAASQPEAKFHVLAAEPARTLTAALAQTRSHLTLGILYARAGLLTEAERELQLYLKQQPQSVVARKLLRQIQSWR
jgi:hypothetical protein